MDLLLVVFNFIHEDNETMAAEDKKYFKKLALKLNIPHIYHVIPNMFLEDDNHFNNEFDQIINSHKLDQMILVIGGRSF